MKPSYKIKIFASAIIILFTFSVNLFSQEIQEVDTVVFPDDFQTEQDYINKKDKVLLFNQTLVVNDNSKWHKYGSLTLSSIRRMSPTEVALPNSSEYHNMVESNNINSITLDDGSSAYFPNPIPFADENGTRRIGSRVSNLKAKLHKYSWGWALIPIEGEEPIFFGNSRPTSIDINVHHNLKVCGFNIEIYLASNYGSPYGGAANEQEAIKQHNKIIKALIAIDADIYSLEEVQTGQEAIRKLCNALNEHIGQNRFSFINDNTSVSSTYTKVGYIYRNDKVAPYGNLVNINNIPSTRNRKKLQCFRVLENNKKIILSINHFKSKSGVGTGGNADAGDGQGNFNEYRVTDANAIVEAITEYSNTCNETDVLILGDLNAHSQEDPLQVLYNAGYSNLLKNNDSSAYSYVYQGLSGCLDHALASESLMPNVVFAEVFHINTDEPEIFGYKNSNYYSNNMYRSSDHDPVVVGLNIGSPDNNNEIQKDLTQIVKLSKNSFVVKNAINRQLTLLDINGRQILYRPIKEKEQVFHLPFNLNGVYFFYLDDMMSPRIKSHKIIF